MEMYKETEEGLEIRRWVRRNRFDYASAAEALRRKQRPVDNEEWGWENDGEDGEEKGAAVQITRQNESGYDIERFIMSLPFDEGRVLGARLLGFQGEQAAKLAGFQSIWVYIRKLKQLQKRTADAKEIAF
jgi:hypothetical protein